MHRLAKIGDIIRRNFSAQAFPREALEALRAGTGCERCGLFFVQYRDDYPHSLVAVHIVPDYRAELSRLEHATFDAAASFFAGDVESTRLVDENGPPWRDYYPIRLDRHLSAVLSLDYGGKGEAARHAGFVEACLPIFSLWFLGANQRKATCDICDFTREPLYIMNTDGVLVMWNQAMTDLSGWNSAQMLGQGDGQNAVPFYGEKRLTVPHLILEPDPAFEKRNYIEFRREGDVVHAITFLPTVHEDGAYVSCKTQRLYDINGRLYAAIHSLNDLTQVRQLEMDLHKLRFIGRMVNDLSENGIALITRDGIGYYNDNMLKILGMPPNSKLLLKHILGLAAKTSMEERDKVIAFNRQVLNAEEPIPPFVEFRVHDELETRNLRCSAYIESSGEETTVMLVFTDITRERSLITQAKDNEMKVMRADRLSSLGILSAGIAHEIAQPLGTIKILADTVLFGRDQGWDTDQESMVQKFQLISKQADRMSQIIEGVRVFSRDENELDTGTCDVNVAVKNVLDILERLFNKRSIRVVADCCPAGLPVSCSLSRLEQVIMNLMLNSRQSLDSCVDHGYKEIVLTTESREGMSYVRIKDNGTGIHPENLERIFDPFFTTKEVGQGTGLGLAICKAIINGAGGDIEVRNNPSRGCTFQILLPILENDR